MLRSIPTDPQRLASGHQRRGNVSFVDVGAGGARKLPKLEQLGTIVVISALGDLSGRRWRRWERRLRKSGRRLAFIQTNKSSLNAGAARWRTTAVEVGALCVCGATISYATPMTAAMAEWLWCSCGSCGAHFRVEEPRVAAPRWPGRLLLLLSVISLITIAAFLWAYSTQNDEVLGRKIGSLVSKEIRGRIEVRRIHWSPRALADLALGTPTPVEIDDVAIYDPRGRRVIAARRIRAHVRPWAMLAKGEIRFSGVDVSGGEVVVEKRPSDTGIGIAETFELAEPSTEPTRGDGIPLLVFERVGVRDVGFRLRVGETWIDLPKINAQGRLKLEGHIDEQGIDLKLASIDARGGSFRQGTALRLPIGPLRCRDARIEGQKLTARDIRAELAGAPTTIDGTLDTLFSGEPVLDARAVVHGAAPFLSSLVKVPVQGRSGLVVAVRGLAAEPKITATIKDTRVKLADVLLDRLTATATLDTKTQEILLQQGTGHALGGRVAVAGTLGLADGRWKAKLKLDDVDPGGVAPELAGRGGGTVSLSGTIDGEASALAVVDLSLRRRGGRRGIGKWIPRRLAARGSIHITSRIIDLAGLTLVGDGNQVRARGSIHLERRRVDVFASLNLPTVGRWLGSRFGFKPLSKAAGRLHVTGVFPRLAARGDIEGSDVGHGQYRLSKVRAAVRFADGTLRLAKIRSDGYGGKLTGQAELGLFHRSLLRPRRRPTMRARLQARGIRLQRVVGSEIVMGALNADVELSGALEALRGEATVSSQALKVGKSLYRTARARVGLLGDRISVYETVLERHNGGRMRVWGDLFFDTRLAMGVRTRRFPLAALPGLEDQELGLKGYVSGELALTGTLMDPRVAGRLSLAGTKVRGADLGDGWLRLRPGSDTIRLQGALLGNLLQLEGFALMQPHRSIHLTLKIHRFPVHRVLPELRRIGDVKGFVSGRVVLDVDEKKGLSWVNTRLSKVGFSMRYRPTGQRAYRTLKLNNQQDILVTYNGSRLEVVTAKVVSSISGREHTRAEFSVGGALGNNKPDLHLRGVVPLQLAEFFFARQIKSVSGRATADLRIGGTIARPTLSGQIALDDGKVTLPRFERPMRIPRARIVLGGNKLQVRQLGLRVGRAKLALSGSVDGIESLVFGGSGDPSLDLKVDGDVNMRLLSLLAPSVFSQSTGRAHTSIVFSGLLSDPQAVGNLIIRKGQRIEFRPRGIGRSVTLTGGHLRFRRSYVGAVRPLTGTYGEGTVQLEGEARFNGGKLVDVFVKLKGRSIPHRQPKVFSAELDLDLTLVGDPGAVEGQLRCGLSQKRDPVGKSMMLQGRVDVVDARYTREFDLLKNAVIQPRVSEDERPFWEQIPQLGALGLCLSVRSSGQLRVKNRYADLGLETALVVTGTLADTRIQGNVRVEEGKVKIPATRPTFTVSRGELAFSPSRAMDDPELDIVAETTHPDRNGTEYKIRLRLTGTLNKIRREFSSEPYLDQGQLLSLVAWGRTTDQLRQDLNRGGDGGQQAGAADAQVKELSSLFLSSILEDPIKKVTGLDLVQLEIGTETLTAKACKKIGSFEICGDLEKSLLGGYSSKGSVRYRLHDYLRLVGRVERLSTKLDREREDPSNARLELKFGFPLR